MPPATSQIPKGKRDHCLDQSHCFKLVVPLQTLFLAFSSFIHIKRHKGTSANTMIFQRPLGVLLPSLEVVIKTWRVTTHNHLEQTDPKYTHKESLGLPSLIKYSFPNWSSNVSTSSCSFSITDVAFCHLVISNIPRYILTATSRITYLSCW